MAIAMLLSLCYWLTVVCNYHGYLHCAGSTDTFPLIHTDSKASDNLCGISSY